ncbi:MAG: Hint domain-containing protein [Pseudomonadota bacterium]
MGAIGEAGTFRGNFSPENVEREVFFEREIDNPVIHLTGTNSGGNQYIFRITEIRPDGFKFIVEEWEYHDGPHGATETINWVAIEEGEHELADGRIIKAGYADASSTAGSVAFDDAFETGPPVVLTTTASNNDPIAIDSDPFQITENGFEIRLQEEEEQDGVHGNETIGWIAIEPGGDGTEGTALTAGGFDESTDTFGLGADFLDPIIAAETQTLNDAEAANIEIRGLNANNDTVRLRLREEQSQDGEVNHLDETLGLAVFERGLIVCFTPGAMIETPDGERAVETLRAGDLVTTRDHGPRPIRQIARRRLTGKELRDAPEHAPVTIAKGAMGAGAPYADLTVSPQHRMLATGPMVELLFGAPEALVPARALAPANARRSGVEGATYIHLLFDRHEIVFANGAATESLHPGRAVIDGLGEESRREILALFPELAKGGEWSTAALALTVREGRALVFA